MADSGDHGRRSTSSHSQGDSYFTSRPPPRSGASLSRTVSGQYRPTLSAIRSPASQAPPASPGPSGFTPTFSRSFSGSLNSPRQNFESSDETFVFEFGARCMKAGLGGEKQPRAVTDFGPETSKRARDYSAWLPSEARNLLCTLNFESWGRDHELWQMDLRGLDMGLVKDKIERAVRDAIVNHVLVVDDSKKRPWTVAVPSQMPQPLMQVLLSALFQYMPSPPSISLLTIPALCAVSAGVRSALVVDIGWKETTVTAVFEYREVSHRRSARGMKRLHWETALLLQRHVRRTRSAEPESEVKDVSFEDSEEVLYRLIHCRPQAMTEQEILKTGSKSATIPLPTSAAKPVVTSFTTLAEPAETTFFSQPGPRQSLDEEESPIPLLIYSTLLAVPQDIRRVCVSRIVFTGGGANIPGLRTRICRDLKSMIDERGWDPVHNYGSAKKISRPKTKLRTPGPVPIDTDDEGEDGGVAFVNRDEDPDSTTPAHLQPPLGDPVVMNIRTRALNGRHGEGAVAQALIDAEDQLPEVRSIETLGAWAGGSLIAGLKVKGTVDIERERFLQYGLLGGPDKEEDKRKSMAPTQAQRQSVVPSAQRNSGGAWTLGVFG